MVGTGVPVSGSCNRLKGVFPSPRIGSSSDPPSGQVEEGFLRTVPTCMCSTLFLFSDEPPRNGGRQGDREREGCKEKEPKDPDAIVGQTARRQFEDLAGRKEPRATSAPSPLRLAGASRHGHLYRGQRQGGL